MKIKTNCNECDAKNSLISVFTRDHYKKKYWTHVDKTAYYICKKCGYHDEFSLNRIISNAGVFWAYFIEDHDINAVKELDEKKKKTCVICEQTTKPPIPAENEISHPAITKLYLKKPKKRFLGYFCAVCRRAYYLPIRAVKWEKSKFFQKKKSEDLLNPLNTQLSEKVLVEHPKYNENVKLVQDKRSLDCIGNFTTTKGVPFSDPDMPMVTITIPRNIYKRTLNNLQKSGCEIIGF